MTIREMIDDDDKIRISIKMMELTGMLEKRQKQRRKFFTILLVISIALFVFAFFLATQKGNELLEILLLSMSLVYSVASIYNLIFSRRIDLKRIESSMRKNLLAVSEKYGIPRGEKESILEINGDAVESTLIGTTVKYLKKDYVKNFSDDYFYMIEFTGGRFIFLKRSTFASEEEFAKIIKEIESVC